jgi:hypothetical protein
VSDLPRLSHHENAPAPSLLQRASIPVSILESLKIPSRAATMGGRQLRLSLQGLPRFLNHEAAPSVHPLNHIQPLPVKPSSRLVLQLV